MDKIKDVLTTHDISVLCGVDITTVINWINSGKLSAYKTPGGHRRVKKDTFLEFVKEYNLHIIEEKDQGGPKILLIEDDEDVREMMSTALKVSFPEAVIWQAEDGFAAGKLLAETNPGVVVMDIRLPGIDGFKVCEMIVADERLKRTKILAVTAFHSEEVRNDILKTGAHDYMTKPFSPQEFIEKVKNLMGA